MRNPLALFNKPHRQQALKERIVKNREGVLDAFAENVQGARQCPLLLGQKCIGGLCEFFMEFSRFNDKTKKSFTFHRCAYVQTPLLLIELRRSIENLFLLMEERTRKELNRV